MKKLECRVALEHGDVEPGARQVGGEREPVVSRADDDAVVGLHYRFPICCLN
jgi:hypothetical protein